MGDGSGLAKGFVLMGFVVLVGSLLWPPLAIKMIGEAIKDTKHPLKIRLLFAAFFSFWFFLQMFVLIGIPVFVLWLFFV